MLDWGREGARNVRRVMRRLGSGGMKMGSFMQGRYRTSVAAMCFVFRVSGAMRGSIVGGPCFVARAWAWSRRGIRGSSSHRAP